MSKKHMNTENKPLLIIAGIGLFLVGSASLAQTDFFLPEHTKFIKFFASSAFEPRVIPTVLFKDAPLQKDAVSPHTPSLNAHDIAEIKKEYIAILSKYLSLVQDTAADIQPDSPELTDVLQRGTISLAALQGATTFDELQSVWEGVKEAYSCQPDQGEQKTLENLKNLCSFSWNDWSPDLSV